MHCPICKEELKDFNEEIMRHLLVVKGSDNSVHVHGPLENKDLMKQFINKTLVQSDLSNAFKEMPVKSLKDRKEIVFHNRQRIGDILMFTCAVRDFKKAYPDVRVNVVSTAGHIWDYNPNIDRTLIPTEENTIKIGPSKGTNQSNRIDWHFANAYRISIEDNLGISIPQTLSRADIWLTEEEFNAPPITKEPYWLIVIGGEKGWGTKMYPFERWQEFVNQNPDTLFYQLGAREDNPARLQGSNIIDYIGKTQDKNTGIRDLFKLFLNAEGSIGLVSFHMHLSGALYKPAIVVAGAREPVSFTRYPGHQYLATDGCLPCAVKACWHCNIDTCTDLVKVNGDKIPKCVDIIQPKDLTNALNKYYEGGRLKKGIQSEKPKFKNIVKTIVEKTIVPVKATSKEPIQTKYGIPFGGGSLTEKDWIFMQDVIKKHNVKTILEFGAGLSTLLLNEIAEVITFETNEGWIKKIKALNPKCDIRLWDGKDAGLINHYDMAFVDGPSGGLSREFSTKIASELARIVIVHDAGREYERQWQIKYIEKNFEGPNKGGHRCHLWTKKIKAPLEMYPPIIDEVIDKSNDISVSPCKRKLSSKSKFIKFVSTARGWGGCARSITTIMKMLMQQDHKVEFIPFRNKIVSREFQDYIRRNLNGLIVTETYDSLKEKCDILFVYADDFVWEFGTPAISEVFSDLHAERKIMMLNYRRGGVGKIPWTKDWNKYMFLNSTQEKDLLQFMPEVKTKVLPPCTELEPFFAVQPNYDDNMRIVRHSSQGDVKFTKTIGEEILDILNCGRRSIDINMLPGPSFVNAFHDDHSGFWKKPRTAEVEVIVNFLSKGNLFWYSLPIGYMDQGPRVVIEAMAAGLPILADNWGGVIDRVTPECGWLCDDKNQFAEVVNNVSFVELKRKGEAARQRAREEFTPKSWVEEILND